MINGIQWGAWGAYKAWHIQGVAHTAGRGHSRMSLVISSNLVIPLAARRRRRRIVQGKDRRSLEQNTVETSNRINFIPEDILHFAFPHVSDLKELLRCSSFRILLSTFSMTFGFILFRSAHCCISFFISSFSVASTNITASTSSFLLNQLFFFFFCCVSCSSLFTAVQGKHFILINVRWNPYGGVYKRKRVFS